MRKTITALLMCLMCIGLNAQVFTTSGKRMPAPQMQRPQMSTSKPLRNNTNAHIMGFRVSKPQTARPKADKPVVERYREPNYYTTQHYFGINYSKSEYGEGYYYSDGQSGVGLHYGFMHNFAGSFHKAFAAYWGVEFAGNYNKILAGDISFTLRGTPQLGLVLGKPSLRLDIRAQTGMVYCSKYLADIHYYYDDDYNEHRENLYGDGGGLYVGLGADLSFKSIMIGARYGAVIETLFGEWMHERPSASVMLGLRF